MVTAPFQTHSGSVPNSITGNVSRRSRMWYYIQQRDAGNIVSWFEQFEQFEQFICIKTSTGLTEALAL